MNSSTSSDQTIVGPHIERVRHEIRRRDLTVQSLENITPAMLRIVLASEELHDFVSLGADDHVKLFFPVASGEKEMRDYTPRYYDNAARTLTLDFAIHDAGPATAWAMGAKVGDTLEIGGPRGSAVYSRDIKNWLLIGDETALPAMGRRIEEFDADVSVTSIGIVSNADERQTFETNASHTAHWAYRPLSDAADHAAALEVLKGIELKPDTFVWIAAEVGVARALRGWLVDHRGVPLSWTKAAGYWKQGQADSHEKLD